MFICSSQDTQTGVVAAIGLLLGWVWASPLSSSRFSLVSAGTILMNWMEKWWDSFRSLKLASLYAAKEALWLLHMVFNCLLITPSLLYFSLGHQWSLAIATQCHCLVVTISPVSLKCLAYSLPQAKHPNSPPVKAVTIGPPLYVKGYLYSSYWQWGGPQCWSSKE